MLWTVVYQTQDTLGPYHLHIYTSPGGGGGGYIPCVGLCTPFNCCKNGNQSQK